MRFRFSPALARAAPIPLGLALALCLAAPLTARAVTHEVTVTVEGVEEIDGVDKGLFGSAGDFYTRVKIDGREFVSEHINNTRTIRPNWTYRHFVDLSSTDIVIEIWDRDGGLRWGDDQVDVTPGSGRGLDLVLKIGPCEVSGDASGDCGTSITTRGSDEGSAELRFRVDVQPVRFGEVEVIVERVTGLDCMDGTLGICRSKPDFYAEVSFDGVSLDNRDLEESTQFKNQEDIAPYWRFSRWVNLDRAPIRIKLRVFDRDGGANRDDEVDLVSLPARHVSIDLDPAACDQMTGPFNSCGDILDVDSRMDIAGDQNDRARLQARIEVHEPPRRYVRCTHNPLWPQPGENVRFAAEVVDANMRRVEADEVSLAFHDSTGVVEHVCNDTDVCTAELVAPASGVFSFGCNTRNRGLRASSGIRTVAVGPPASGPAIPVLRNAPVADAIDIVFLADRDHYASAQDPGFLDDVRLAIREGYFSYEIYLRNQQRFNFWVASDTADAEGYDAQAQSCTLGTPSNWIRDYGFADVGAVLHRDADLRDCADPGLRLFSSGADEYDTLRHETGHVPFGLMDEYCCDGGYYQAPKNPNVFGPLAANTSTALTDCLSDPLSRLRDSCAEFVSTRNGSTWFRLDHAPESEDGIVANDLMVDNLVPRAADERRIQAVLDQL